LAIVAAAFIIVLARQRLLDVSKHEPDPLAAITEAEQRQPAK
jgi:hypothetical protein